MKPFSFLLILISLWGCRKEDPLLPVTNPNPVFTVQGTANGVPFQIEAGNDDYYMSPHCGFNQSGYYYSGFLYKSDYLPSLTRFGIDIYAVSPSLTDTNVINQTLYKGRKIFFLTPADTGLNMCGKAIVSCKLNNKNYYTMFAPQPDSSNYILIQKVEEYPPASWTPYRVKKVDMMLSCRVFFQNRSDSVDLKNVTASFALGYY
ncbi:MAG: hypothetical protein IT247_02025 [Bacteroidia bacterium]|nr:hypothetical protein [Bacteroidia bacterium]